MSFVLNSVAKTLSFKIIYFVQCKYRVIVIILCNLVVFNFNNILDATQHKASKTLPYIAQNTFTLYGDFILMFIVK